MSRLQWVSVTLATLPALTGFAAIEALGRAGHTIVWWLPLGVFLVAFSVMVWLPTGALFLVVAELVAKNIARKRGHTISPPRLRSVALVIVVVFWLPATVVPQIVTHEFAPLWYSGEIANARSLSIAALQYAGDHHDHLPKAARWSDDLLPYVHDHRAFRSPLAHRLRCAYAFNAALSNVRVGSIVEPASVVLIFGSDRGWNAAGGAALLPATPRIHGWSDVYAFADGHVRAVHGRPPTSGQSALWYPKLKELR